MRYPEIASTAVRFFERIPTLVWAVWIAGVLLGTGLLALRGGPLT